MIVDQNNESKKPSDKETSNIETLGNEHNVTEKMSKCCSFMTCVMISAATSAASILSYHLLHGKNLATSADIQAINSNLSKLQTALVPNTLSKPVFKQEGISKAVKAMINDRDRLSRSVHRASAEKILNLPTKESLPTHDGGQVVTKVE